MNDSQRVSLKRPSVLFQRVSEALSGLTRWRALLIVAIVYFLASPWQIPHHNLRRNEALFFLNIGNLGVAFHYPTVLTGDEPHYLIILHSLLDDFDLDLTNNYAQSRAGDWDAGFWFRYFPLDLHTARGRNGGAYTYHHGVGMPALLALFLFPMRRTQWVEPLAVLFSSVIALIALAFAGRVLELEGRAEFAGPVVLLGGLCTPIFAYARGLWTENFALVGFVLVLYLWLQGARWFWIALVVMATVLCRYPAALQFVVLLGIGIWLRKGRLAGIVAGLAAAAAAILILDQLCYAQLMPPLSFEVGNPLIGFSGTLFSARHGLFVFTPVLAFGVVGLFWWKEEQKLLPTVFLAIVGAHLLVNSFYVHWHGGTSYDCRYLHATILPLTAGCLEFWKKTLSMFWKALFLLTLGYSALINLYAGFLPGAAVDRSPFWMIHHVASYALR